MENKILSYLQKMMVSKRNTNSVVQILPGANAEAPLMAINHKARVADLTYMVIYIIEI